MRPLRSPPLRFPLLPSPHPAPRPSSPQAYKKTASADDAPTVKSETTVDAGERRSPEVEMLPETSFATTIDLLKPVLKLRGVSTDSPVVA